MSGTSATRQDKDPDEDCEASSDVRVQEASDGVSLPDNQLVDYISGRPVAATAKELVRQQIARALFHEYEISVDDMERDFPVPVSGGSGRSRRRKIDIAVFQAGTEHILANLRRLVICKAEPKNSTTVTRIRTHDQAERDLNELRDMLGDETTPEVRYGMWTNRIELFFLEKTVERFGVQYRSIADWPLLGERVSRSVVSHAQLRRADPGMIMAAFRRCHNYIHGNEGMPKDAAFWQFLYLLFAKMHDEQEVRAGEKRRFYAGLDEPFKPAGQQEIAVRVRKLFEEVKSRYPLFGSRDELTVSDRALAFLVGELAPYDLGNSEIDAKGLAYQELVGSNLRGDRGQFFTPRAAIDLMVEILDPGEHETVLDPASGTGGFLRGTIRHLLRTWREQEGTSGRPDTDDQSARFRSRLSVYARQRLFGADFDPFLVRATSMNVMLLAGAEGNIYHLDSLAFPGGHLDGVASAAERIPLGSVDVLMTNPPFGADIKVTDPAVLDQYRAGVARPWTRDRATGEVTVSPTSAGVGSMTPEQLFIQRSVEWLRPGGRLGIVLPNGILSNPGPVDEAIRRWILDHCWVLASVELPMQTFVAEAGVNIITSLLFLKRKTSQEVSDSLMGASPDYPIFMAIAEQVGVDRRNNPVYRRTPSGEIEYAEQTEREWVRSNGHHVERVLHRRVPVVDNDLPVIADRYREFRRRHPEPGRGGMSPEPV